MKIKFFSTIMWKLLLYYFVIIIITVGVFYIITLTSFRKFADTGRTRDMETRVRNIARILSAKYTENQDFDNLKKSFKELARISGMNLKLLDNDNNQLSFFEDPGRPPFLDMKNIVLQKTDLENLTKGRNLSEIRIDKKSGKKFLYLAFPIFNQKQVIGSIFTIVPMDLPFHFDRLIFDSVTFATIIACIVALFFSNSFTKPIRKMEEAARSMAQGDFSHRMNLNRNDELGFLAIAFDHMSQRLKKHIESRMKLMGDISHELNTPLTTIQASAETMYDGMVTTEEERKKYLKSILSQSKRLAFLISDIAELSKFEAGEVRVNKVTFEAVEPVRRAIESSTLTAGRKDIKVRSVIENENLKVVGDPDRILQIVQNLLNNAIQHNPTGIEVLISIKEDKDKVMFSVQDYGKGIPENELENIFERFHKVDKARTSGESGSGLGLAIVREILDAHGEKIQVTSSDKGSIFSFHLPVSS